MDRPLEYICNDIQQSDEIIELFRSAFTDSEGRDEGELIGQLAKDLLDTTNKQDLHVFSACEESTLVGCIMFSRLRYEQDERIVFLLAPVAVATKHQKHGIGQGLLKHGLTEMKKRGVDTVITYGDPAYYSKVGFIQITEQQALPPLKLQYPHGWLAQSLIDNEFTSLRGPSQCVEALNNPQYW